MLNQIYDNEKIVEFTGNTAKRMDPFSADVVAHNARYVEASVLVFDAFRNMFGLISRVFDKIAAWHRASVVSRELKAMPDYILADIGVRRDQIDAVATGELTREASSLSPAGAQPVSTLIEGKDDDHPLAA